MAKTPVNSGLEAVSGRLGAWVYRVVEGETVIAPRPQLDPDRPSSQAQQDVRERFRLAAGYAKRVFDDPVRKASYLQLALRRGVSAARLFGFVLQDFSRPPVVTAIVATEYNRQPGSVIDVHAKDDGEVVKVLVAIKAADGTVLEQGEAPVGDYGWRYVATAAAPAGALTIEATAIDRPGNKTVKEVVI